MVQRRRISEWGQIHTRVRRCCLSRGVDQIAHQVDSRRRIANHMVESQQDVVKLRRTPNQSTTNQRPRIPGNWRVDFFFDDFEALVRVGLMDTQRQFRYIGSAVSWPLAGLLDPNLAKRMAFLRCNQRSAQDRFGQGAGNAAKHAEVQRCGFAQPPDHLFEGTKLAFNRSIRRR